ncbi:hypothetical protein ACET3X_005314 [Alternaria dauci]|uniref:FAD/NAD(P)-binding domain-containing protein n=1 Tax=Alternaria dauci TaxID=48095 RepID=A0ABR3UMF4_9PLEO
MTDGTTQSHGFPHAARERLSIIIVGASLGGLATALALKRLPAPHGHTITLLERNPTALLHNQGAGIVAGGDTLAFFKRYDRCKRDLAVTSTQRQYLNKHGQVIHKQDVTLNMTSWDLAYYMLRANVDGIESDYCDTPHDQDSGSKITHLHGHKVVELQDKGNKLVVKYETSDGSTGEMEADLVIGADGPSSTVRSLLTTGIERTYAGYVALRGTVPENSNAPPGKIDLQAWEKQRKIASERLPPQFAEIVKVTEKPFVQAITDVVAPTNEFMSGRVILIGDALAGFRPHTAASTSQACFDAMILADMIEGKVSRSDWKKKTLGYARTLQKRGVDMGERSQHQDLPLEEHIRDRNLASKPRVEETWPE